MMCQKCLDFGHTQKNCKRDISICGRCNQLDHMSRDCNSDTTECHHCRDHPTKSSKCSLYRYEKEICIIKIRQKVSRQQAKLFLIFKIQISWWILQKPLELLLVSIKNLTIQANQPVNLPLQIWNFHFLTKGKGNMIMKIIYTKFGKHYQWLQCQL